MTLSAAAVAVLTEPDPAAKAAAAQAVAERWRSSAIVAFGDSVPPDRPARPDRPELLPPRLMPKRGKAQTLAGRVALLHALAHIELNAIDLASDLIARFGGGFPRSFGDDWTTVAAEEALHFTLLTDRLADCGAVYGDLPAHDGLWQAAAETADDALARLAIVPLVLEARGLDVTPPMIASLRKAGDDRSAAVLERLYDDEIGHVATGPALVRLAVRRARAGAAVDLADAGTPPFPRRAETAVQRRCARAGRIRCRVLRAAGTRRIGSASAPGPYPERNPALIPSHVGVRRWAFGLELCQHFTS